MKVYDGKVGFLSWTCNVIPFFEKLKKDNEKLEFLIEEFINFLKNKLEGVITMDEIQKVIDVYKDCPYFNDLQTEAQNYINNLLIEIKNEIIEKYEKEISETEEDKNKIESKMFPCIYTYITLKKWHTDPAIYIFANLFEQKAGIVFAGFECNDEDDEVRKLFLNKHSDIRKRFEENKELEFFKWTEEYEDKKIEKGYYTKCSMKLMEDSKTNNFYFGYSYDLLQLLENPNEINKKMLKNI